MKRPAFLSGFLMMLVGLGLTIAVMFVLPFHKDAAAPCFYPENRGIYTQSDSPKKSSRNIWSLAVVSVDQRY